MASGHSEPQGDLEVGARTGVGFPWEGGGRRARPREGPLRPRVLCSRRDRGHGTRVCPTCTAGRRDSLPCAGCDGLPGRRGALAGSRPSLRPAIPGGSPVSTHGTAESPVGEPRSRRAPALEVPATSQLRPPSSHSGLGSAACTPPRRGLGSWVRLAHPSASAGVARPRGLAPGGPAAVCPRGPHRPVHAGSSRVPRAPVGSRDLTATVHLAASGLVSGAQRWRPGSPVRGHTPLARPQGSVATVGVTWAPDPRRVLPRNHGSKATCT